ncbi:MAG: Bax inhibitor-1/YccA family protein [Pseudomonadota bacterium]|jgi:modulator of FtsH protease
MDRNPLTIDSTATLIASRADSDAQRVLRNTYLLLSASLLFSAATAGASMAYGWPYPGIIVTLVMFYGLLFAIEKMRNSAWSVALVFALTGFMGLTLGPIISMYIRALPHGSSIVMTSLGVTGGTFLTLSAYAVFSKKRFEFMASFLFVGSMIAFLLGLVSIFFHMEALSLAVSGMFALISSGMILWQTGEIVNGGERNYVLATVSLYISIYNLFLSLLRILGAGDRR